MPAPVKTPQVLSVISLLRPHWKAMTMAMVGVAGIAATELLEPWPLKIVIDHLLQARPLDGWMGAVVGWFGADRLAVLNVAVLAVAVIAVGGCRELLPAELSDHQRRPVGHARFAARAVSPHPSPVAGRARCDTHRRPHQPRDERHQHDPGLRHLGAARHPDQRRSRWSGIVGVMLYLNWRFTLISLSIAPLLFLVVYVFTRRIKKASRDVRKKEGELLSIVQEVFSSIRVVKAFAREDYEERRFAVQSLDNVETTLAARNIKMMLAPVVEIIVATGTCLMLWYGARLVIADQLTAGALVVFLLYLGKMYKPMRDLSKMTDTVSKAGVSLERIREVLETESGVRDAPRARKCGPLQGPDCVRQGVVRVRPRPGDPEGCELRDRAGPGRGVRRPDGRRQVHHHQPGGALLRSGVGHGLDRRHGHPQLHDEVDARPDQLRAAGDAALPRADLAEHRLRPP